MDKKIIDAVREAMKIEDKFKPSMSIREMEKTMAECVHKDGVKIKKVSSPYFIFEADYWRRDRDICVVDEINQLPKYNVEIICGTNPKNEGWVRCLAEGNGFIVKKEEKKDGLGPFFKFTIRKKE
jgi:hypothetical protein